MGNSRIKRQHLSIGQQIFHMRTRFPQFQYCHTKSGPTWRGVLRTSNETPECAVKVMYRGNLPKVWIVSPDISADARHRFRDGSLCLYEPQDHSWHQDLFIADTIIPWTVEWIRLYELWLITGIWYGLEASHSPLAK